MNKIILSVILLLSIILSFCACSSKKLDEYPTTADTTTTEPATTEPVVETTTEPDETATTRNPLYDDPMYEGLTDEERELIIGAFGEDFEFEGIDELSSKQISKLLKYARSVGKRVKIRNSRLVISTIEGETVTTTEKVTEKATEKITEKVTEKPTERVTEKPTEKPTEKDTENVTETATTEAPQSTIPDFLPVPPFGKITLRSGNDKEYAITVTDFTVSNIDEYITLLTNAGFTQGAEKIDDLENGVFSYSASKTDGTTVNLSLVTADSLVITVKTPQ